MNFNLENIEFADNKIIEMLFSNDYNAISIITEGSYHVIEKKWLGKTTLLISDWKELIVEKYSSEDSQIKSQGQTLMIDWKKEPEKLDMILESVLNKKDLSLSGFSKETGAWLIYNFKDCNYAMSAE